MEEDENLIKENNQSVGFNVPEGYTKEMDRKRKKDIENYADQHDRFMDHIVTAYEDMNNPVDGDSKIARAWMFYKCVEVMNIVRREAQARGDHDMVDTFEEMVGGVSSFRIDYMGRETVVNPNEILSLVDQKRRIGECEKLDRLFDRHGLAINDFVHFSLKGSEVVKRGSEEDEEDATSQEGL